MTERVANLLIILTVRNGFQTVIYSTIVGKDLIFRYPAWIFQFFHATKPQNSHGFCVELAGITREFSRELQEIFARNSRMVTRDAWSLLYIPEDRSFQHRSQKSREECEDNRSHAHAIVLLYTIKRLSRWLIISFYSDFFSFIFIFIYWWRVFNETNKWCKYQHKNVKYRRQNIRFLKLWEQYMCGDDWHVAVAFIYMYKVPVCDASILSDPK